MTDNQSIIQGRMSACELSTVKVDALCAREKSSAHWVMQHCNVAVPLDDQPSSLDSQQSGHSHSLLLLVHHLVETCQMLLPAIYTSEARRIAIHCRTGISDHLACVAAATCMTTKNKMSVVNSILLQTKLLNVASQDPVP